MSAAVAASPSPLSSASCLRHVLVVGGSGFVGGAVCRSALRHGLIVSSLSRTGCSPYDSSSSGGVKQSVAQQTEWMRNVRWCKGDVLSADGQWRGLLGPAGAAAGASGGSSVPVSESLPPIDAVVSCVGGFGSVATMVRVNGTANIAVFEAANAAQQIRRIGFVSAYHYQLPSFLQRGYMEGKLAAESKLAALFPSSASSSSSSAPSSSPISGGLSRAAVVSHSGFLYGSRYVRSLGVHLPLQFIGAPLGWLTDNAAVRALRQAPVVGPLLTLALLPPVSVDALGDAMIQTLMDSSLQPGVHALSVEDIRRQQQQQQQQQQQHAKEA